MTIPGDLNTTAMAVMPHKDADRALEFALSMDIPFWPQLPHVSYYEDMYVQAAEHFPVFFWIWKNEPFVFPWISSSMNLKRPWPILTNLNTLTSAKRIR